MIKNTTKLLGAFELAGPRHWRERSARGARSCHYRLGCALHLDIVIMFARNTFEMFFPLLPRRQLQVFAQFPTFRTFILCQLCSP